MRTRTELDIVHSLNDTGRSLIAELCCIDVHLYISFLSACDFFFHIFKDNNIFCDYNSETDDHSHTIVYFTGTEILTINQGLIGVSVLRSGLYCATVPTRRTRVDVGW